MFSNRFAVALLAAACIASAAAGGYLATRQNATTMPVAAASRPTPAPTAPSAPLAAERPVQETEGVIGEKNSSAAPTPVEPISPAFTKQPATPVTPEKKETSARAAARPAATDTAPSAQDARERAAQNAPAPPAPVSAAGSAAPSTSAQGVDSTAAQLPRPDDHAAPEPPRAPEPPPPTVDELVVASDSVIGLQTETSVTSETARIEDRVDARVTRDVRVGDRVAIPAGTRAIGSVALVERGGKFKERARLGIRFHTLVLADGTRVPISTEMIIRDGDAPTSAARIGGGAVGGAIIGAILGGAKGAAIGGAAGAGAGAATAAAGDRNAARLPAGTQTTVRILSPVTVTVER